MKRQSQISPLAIWLIHWLCREELVEEILGDLEEYNAMLEGQRRKIRILTWLQVFSMLRPSLVKSLIKKSNYLFMDQWKLLFKTSLRNMAKQRVATMISLLSLTLGLVSFQLVFSWIHNEHQMNKFHAEHDNIYMSTAKTSAQSDYYPLAWTEFFKVDFAQLPEVKSVVHIRYYDESQFLFKTNTAHFPAKAIVADSTFFNFFDFPILSGQRDKLLRNPGDILITEDFALKTFGTLDVIGKSVEIACDQTGNYRIASLLKSIPSNSAIDFDILIPVHSKNRWRKIPHEFFLTSTAFDLDTFNQKVIGLGKAQSRFKESSLRAISFGSIYEKRPFDLSLFSKYGNPNSYSTMVIIALIILFITLLSFTNLQTTVLLSSSHKIGIKHVIGASRESLALEVVANRLLFVLAASMIAFMLYQVLFTWLVDYLGIQLDSKPIFDFTAIFLASISLVFLSMLLGIIKMYSIDLKIALHSHLADLSIPKMQRALTAIQYSITTLLIFSTLVVFVQYQFMVNRDLGFDESGIVRIDYLNLVNSNNQQSNEIVINSLRDNPFVIEVSQGKVPVNNIIDKSSWKVIGQVNGFESVNKINVDVHYASLLSLEVVEGRFFSDSLDKSGHMRIVLNQEAMRFFNIKDINSVKLQSNSIRKEENYSIVGVVKDFHYEHLSLPISPLVLIDNTYNDDDFLIKIEPNNQEAGIGSLEGLYEELNPNGIFSYEWIEDRVTKQYAEQEQIGKMYFALTVIALLLSTIGLFTFALYEANRRTKEIGIRKVNGASSFEIARLMSYSFLKSVVIANLIALPICWIVMTTWLNDFAYHIDLAPWMFCLPFLISLLVALMTILGQITKVATRNPIECLRYE